MQGPCPRDPRPQPLVDSLLPACQATSHLRSHRKLRSHDSLLWMESQRHRQPHPSQTHKPQFSWSGKKLKLTLVWPHHQSAPCWSNLTLGKCKPHTRQRISLRGLLLKHRIGSELIASVIPDGKIRLWNRNKFFPNFTKCAQARHMLHSQLVLRGQVS